MDAEVDIPSMVQNRKGGFIKTRVRKDTGKIQYLATDLLDLLSEKYLLKDAY